MLELVFIGVQHSVIPNLAHKHYFSGLDVRFLLKYWINGLLCICFNHPCIPYNLKIVSLYLPIIAIVTVLRWNLAKFQSQVKCLRLADRAVVLWVSILCLPLNTNKLYRNDLWVVSDKIFINIRKYIVPTQKTIPDGRRRKILDIRHPKIGKCIRHILLLDSLYYWPYNMT